MAFPSYTKTYHTTTYPAISPSLPQLSNQGKVIVITGGGSGVGPKLATSFFHSSPRAIALIGRTSSTLLSTKTTLDGLPSPSSAARPEILTYTASITSATAIQAIFSELKEKYGGIDVLILNAASFPHPEPITSVSPDTWSETLDINILGPLHLTQAFLSSPPSLQHKESERIILNVTTAGVHLPAMPFPIAAYLASKIAGVKMMEYLAGECKGKVRVVSVHPGIQDTEQGKRAATVGMVMPFDDVQLPADFLVWAASPEADFLHGKLVWANWDVDELKAKKEEIISGPALTLGLNGWP